MTPSFTTTLDRLQSPHLFPLRLLAPTSLKFTPTCLTSTFRVTFTTPINTTPFKYKGTVFGGRKKGRIKIIKSELNAVGDDKGATDATEEKAARAALEQLDSQLSALAEKKVFKERNTEYLDSHAASSKAWRVSYVLLVLQLGNFQNIYLFTWRM